MNDQNLSALTLEQIQTAVYAAHNEIHKGNVQKAHEMLHMAVHGQPVELPTALSKDVTKFEYGFNKLARVEGVIAAFVVAKQSDIVSAKGVRMTLIAGGDADLCAMLKKALAPQTQPVKQLTT
jgi:hypothetical protein